MSVTNHNSLWGDASEFGRFMKIETADYSANNTSNDDSADDYNRYANVTSEFYHLNDDGTPKLDSKKNPVVLDEQSGESIVTRIYGDVYFYNTGNEYTWGGSGTTYNFGNGYEENHIAVSDPYVPSDEVFDLPETDSDNWNTSKTWGQEYSYNKGAEYGWQEGYADSSDTLKNNHFCSYSIGLGYEESYTVAPAGKTVASAKSGFTSNHDDWSTSSLSLSAASLGISKSYGDGYEYSCGKGFSIQEGDTEEHVYGTSTSYVHGHSYEYVGDSDNHSDSDSTVYGDSTETVHGDSTSTVYGVTTDHHWGRANEILGGGAASLNMGGMIEMTLGAVEETALSAKMEIALGAFLEICMGLKTEIFLGGKIEISAGAKAEISTAEDCDLVGGAKIEATLTKIQAIIGPKLISAPLNVNVP
jgi:hypothetical protein